MIRKRIENLVFMNLRTKLLIILVVFAIAPSFFLYHQVMTRYKSDMVDVASQSVHSIVKSNNNLIDTTLSKKALGCQALLRLEMVVQSY